MAEAHDDSTGTLTTNMNGDFNGDFNSKEASQLAEISAQATLKYSVKDYNAAAEFYSQATELQAEINGEMSPQNAELLYAYGRCLYHVAVKNSDVLGSKVAGEQQDNGQATSTKKPKGEQKRDLPNGQDTRTSEEVVTQIVEEKSGPLKPEEEPEKCAKPYFQFTGDDNWDMSEEEDENDQGDKESEDAEEEDDFVNAFEVLDLARILLLKKLAEARDGAGKTQVETQNMQQLKERLADIYDLQAEISLEGERFLNAVVDLKSALELKTALYPPESSILAETHYKLSLALEFSSVTQRKDSNGEPEAGKDGKVDEVMREEAANHMEAAITSCKLRIGKEESNLAKGLEKDGDTEKSSVTKDDIEDVKEMVKEMEQRLVELRQPPVSVNDPLGTGTVDGSYPLTGILGSILGEDPAAQKARLQEASKGAKDLTDLVKRKRPVESESSRSAESGGKRTKGNRKMVSAGEVSGKRIRISEGDNNEH